MPTTTIGERVADLETCTSELATIIAGTPRPQIAGGGRNPDGLVHKVETLQSGQNALTQGQNALQLGQERIEAAIANGGMATHLTGSQRVALWTAAIGAIGLGTAALIGALV